MSRQPRTVAPIALTTFPRIPLSTQGIASSPPMAVGSWLGRFRLACIPFILHVPLLGSGEGMRESTSSKTPVEIPTELQSSGIGSIRASLAIARLVVGARALLTEPNGSIA